MKKAKVSKYGQWKYPGEDTIIPNANGNITMQGVPYPVLGIDDLGNQQMMMPGMDYQFPGNSVYEIPMMRYGGDISIPSLKRVRIKSLPKAQTIGELKEQALQRDINRQQAKAWDPNETYGYQEEPLNYNPKTGEYTNWKGEVVRVETKPMVIGSPKGAPKKSKVEIEKEKAIKYDKQTKADPTAWLAEHPEYMLDANGNPILRSMMEQAAPEELKKADIKQAKEEFVKDLNSDPLQQSLGTASLDNPVTNAAAENYANYKVNNIDPGRASDQLFRGYAAPTTRDFYQPHNVSNTLRGAAGLGATAAGITGLSYGLAALPALGEAAYAWGAANPFISATGAALTASPAALPGASLANLANAGFITHGVSQLPETYEAWNNAINNGGSYLDATGQTLLNSLDFLGVGELKAPGILDDIVGKSIQEASAAGVDPAKVFVENLGKEGIIKPEAISNFTKEQWQEAAKFLERRQFVKQLQKDRLIGEGVKPADINYFARSNDRVSKLTQNALDADATLYRGVRGNKPHAGYQEYTGRQYDMMKPAWGNEISEYENMVRAGVDFENPLSIAEYQATHVPMESYGYRAGMPDMGKVDAIYAASEPSDYYGNYLFEIKLPRDYSKGSFKDWYDKYFKGQQYFDDVWNAEDKAGRNIYSYVTPINKEMPLRLSRSGYPTVIGRKGEKLLSVNKDFPFTDLKRLNTDPEYAKAFNEYREAVRNNYNTGWLDKIKQSESPEYLNSLQNEYNSLTEKGVENLTQDELLKALDLEAKLNKASGTTGEILNSAENPNVPESLAKRGYKSTHKELADLTDKLRRDRIKFWQSPTGKARLEAVIENTPEIKTAGITVNDYIRGIENMTVENRTAVNNLMRGKIVLDERKLVVKELEEIKLLEQQTGVPHSNKDYIPGLERKLKAIDEEFNDLANSYNKLRVNSTHEYNAFMGRTEPAIESEPGVLNLQKTGVNKDTKFITGVGPKYDLDEAERIINHELGHLIQRGVKTNLDKELEGLDLLKTEANDLFSSANKKSDYFNRAIDYFRSGSKGKEKLPFLEEVRSDMLQKGIIKDFGDEITESMIKNHYANYMMEARSDKGALRIYDIMKNDPKNFSILKSVMNKMPAVVIGTGVGYGMMNQGQDLPQKKFGGNIINTLNNYKNKFKDGGELPKAQAIGVKKSNFNQTLNIPLQFQQAPNLADVHVKMPHNSGWGDFTTHRVPSVYDAVKSGNLYSIEESINKYLGYPMDKAYDAADRLAPEGEDPIDSFRHPTAAMYTQQAIKDKVGIPGLGDALGFLGANASGIGHELSTLFNDERPWDIKLQEAGEDAFNNFAGSVIGLLPGTQDQKANLIYNMSLGKWLPDGIVSEDPNKNMYLKDEQGNVRRDTPTEFLNKLYPKKNGGSKKKSAGFKILTDANGKYVFVKT